MGTAMTSTAMQRRRNRLLRRLPALVAASACLVATGSPRLLGSAGAAAPTSAATTPAQPVPAPARAQNGLDATSSVAPSNAGGTSAPAASTPATPTTTYAPSTGTALPNTTPSMTHGATPSTTPGAATPGAAASTPATSAAQPAAPAQGRTTAKKGDRPLSTGAIVIAALAALLVLVCAAWGIARLTAFEPRWLISLRHSMAEAGFRVSATWSEFTDWVRLGH